MVLFFYPAAMTMGCTRESCHFRDLKAEFEGLGAQRLGISADTVAKQKQFSDTHSFDYPLLSDTDRTVAKQFGVKRGLSILPNKRATFVIGTDSKVARRHQQRSEHGQARRHAPWRSCVSGPREPGSQPMWPQPMWPQPMWSAGMVPSLPCW